MVLVSRVGLALGLCLALPVGAFGQAVTGGSPLNNAPNLHGCEVKPTLDSFSGNYSARPSNTADCTWFSTGIFGGEGNSGRGDEGRQDHQRHDPDQPRRPAAGALHGAAAVRRRLVSGNRQCCFLAGQTGLVQAAPGISSHAVNLPVERNTNTANNLVTQDYIGVSAVSGTGILPIFTNGRNNTLSDYTFGNNTAGFIYPRLGSQPGDGGGGRREEGIPGVEVLLRYTLCPDRPGVREHDRRSPGPDRSQASARAPSAWDPRTRRSPRRRHGAPRSRSPRSPRPPTCASRSRGARQGPPLEGQVPQAHTQAARQEAVYALEDRQDASPQQPRGRPQQHPVQRPLPGQGAQARALSRVDQGNERRPAEVQGQPGPLPHRALT